MKLTIFYSVQNGGDGSAYPRLMESRELAEYDQENMEEGWGESCAGSFSFESDTPIRCLDKIVTKESYFIDRFCTDHKAPAKRSEFVSRFFPDGLPLFTVEMEKNNKDYTYNHVFVDGRKVASIFRLSSKSGRVFEDFLNSI